LVNTRKRILIPDLIAVSNKTFNLAFDENLSSYEIIAELCNSLDGVKAEYFTTCIDRIVQGFDIFKKNLKAKRQKNDNLSLERFYVEFCDKFNCDETAVFRDLFEYVNVRTYSEALCETIGSLMLLAFSSGRGLHPPNLNKEICIRYNAPPLHILKEKLIPKVTRIWIEQEKKEFSRKGEDDNRQNRKFKFKSVSASIGNQRLKEESNTMLPLSLFI